MKIPWDKNYFYVNGDPRKVVLETNNHRPSSKDSQRYDSLEIKYRCFMKSYKT